MLYHVLYSHPHISRPVAASWNTLWARWNGLPTYFMRRETNMMCTIIVMSHFYGSCRRNVMRQQWGSEIHSRPDVGISLKIQAAWGHPSHAYLFFVWSIYTFDCTSHWYQMKWEARISKNYSNRPTNDEVRHCVFFCSSECISRGIWCMAHVDVM